MENYVNAMITGIIWIVVAVFFWKIYPLLKDNAVYRKAVEIVHLMEEEIGAGNGTVKFEKAVELLQNWVNSLGWKIDVNLISDTITAAVGALHAEQGKIPVEAFKKKQGV